MAGFRVIQLFKFLENMRYDERREHTYKNTCNQPDHGYTTSSIMLYRITPNGDVPSAPLLYYTTFTCIAQS